MKQNLESNQAPLVAIVDDDESLRSSAVMLVNSFGFRSEAFGRGQDFLKRRLLDEVSCVILDVLMPDMNGLELQRQLMRTHPRIPIIFITAHAKEHEERLAMDAGAVDMLRKPVAEGILLNSLRKAFHSRGIPVAGDGSSIQGAKFQQSMNSSEGKDDPPADFPSQALFELELRIARRADELATMAASVHDRNLECWLRAEREVLAE